MRQIVQFLYTNLQLFFFCIFQKICQKKAKTLAPNNKEQFKVV